jgi:signal transduction histidine kinase
VTLGRWPHPERFTGRPVAPELGAAMRAHASGLLPRTTLGGEDVLAAYAEVPDVAGITSFWHVAISLPRREVEAPLRRAAIRALTAGGAVLLAGLVLAGMVARGITGPIARLQALAAVPAHVAPSPTGLPETDAVARALLDATAAREEALARTQALTDTLEHRVAQEVAAREAAQTRAAHGERMQALGELAGGIAHDFNNVLQTVENAAARLTRPNADATDIQQAARLLGVAVRHGAAITGRLLGFARRRPLAPAPLALPPLLTELTEMLRSTLAGRVKLMVAAPADLPPVLADRAQLETVLINLATNARDAMPNGGKLTFTAAEAPPPASLPAGRRYVALAAADTGPGMAPELLARVTEPFFTTKPPGKGTGLGLTLAHTFAAQSGGTLTIDSAPGAGTTVTLWLPVA